MSVAGVFLIQRLEGSRFGTPALWVLNGWADGESRRHNPDYEFSDATESHGCGFLIGRISGVRASQEENSSERRWLITISEFARITYPDLWDHRRNPVRYASLEELGITLDGVEFQPVELLDKEYRPPPMTMSGGFWEEVEQWWPFLVLRQAAEDGDSEGCKRLLYSFLLELNVRLPKGVLIPFRWKRGRPSETEAIYEAWIAKGRPTTTWRVCDELAKSFYAPDFAQAKSDPNLRKKLRDRVRATLLRHKLVATKSAPIS